MNNIWIFITLLLSLLLPDAVNANQPLLNDRITAPIPDHIRLSPQFQSLNHANNIPLALHRQFTNPADTVRSRMGGVNGTPPTKAITHKQKMRELKARLIYKQVYTKVSKRERQNLHELDVDFFQLNQTTVPAVVADVTITQTGTISGQVTNGLAGIPGVWVHAFDRNYNWVTAAATNSSGDYTITGLAADDHKLHFIGNALGYINKWYNNKTVFYTGDLITVSADTTTSDINAVLERGGSISGLVTDGAAPVSGVTVLVYDSNYIWLGDAVTDNSGQYLLAGLPSGEHRVSFSANTIGYLNEWHEDKTNFTTADPVTVTAPATTTNIDAVLQQGGSISGLVTDGSSGIGEVWVYAYDSNYQWLGYSITNNNGEYLFTGLPVGDHKIEFSAIGTGYVSEWYTNKADFASADQVAVTGGGTTAGINAVLEPDGVISGRITGVDGLGLAGVSVSVSRKVDGYHLSVDDTETDVNGNYTFTGLQANDYQLRFSPLYDSGYLPQYYKNQYPLHCNEPDKVLVTTPGVTVINIVLQLGGTITGRVTDGNAPIEGVSVGLVDINSCISMPYYTFGYTDANGEYTLNPIPTGQHKVSFRHIDYAGEWYMDQVDQNSADLITITAPQVISGMDAVLQPGGRISGRVTNGAAPLSDVSVYTYDSNYKFSGWTQTDSDGYYLVTGLQTGDHKVKFSKFNSNYAYEWYGGTNCFENATAVPVTAPLESVDIDADLEPGGAISGQVTDGTTGIKGVAVAVFACDHEPIKWVYTDAAGYYLTDSPLIPDNYKVRFLPPWYGEKNYAIEWYNGGYTYNEALEVPVTNANTTTGIDVVLDIGGSISGRVTKGKINTSYVIIAVYDSNEELLWKTAADDNGNYQVDLLPPGDHLVKFLDFREYYWGVDGFFEWYDNKHDFSAAIPVTVTPPATTTGINAVLGFENRFIIPPILMLLLDSP